MKPTQASTFRRLFNIDSCKKAREFGFKKENVSALIPGDLVCYEDAMDGRFNVALCVSSVRVGYDLSLLFLGFCPDNVLFTEPRSDESICWSMHTLKEK